MEIKIIEESKDYKKTTQSSINNLNIKISDHSLRSLTL